MSTSPGTAPHDVTFTMRPVGVVRSPFKVHEGTPRQPGVEPVRDGEIVLARGLQNLVKDLAGFSHIWVVFVFSYARGFNDQVVPPRDTTKRGLFATRAPHRPNPIGLSVVRLLSVRGTRLRVRGLDMLDGTPVLDIKPYCADYDAIPDASRGWLAELPPEPRPDHRSWREEPPPAAAASGVYPRPASSRRKR